MKFSTISLLLLCLVLSLSIDAQEKVNPLKPTYTNHIPFDTIPVFVDDVYFKQAYSEFERMLDGRDSLNFKRAVFLVEWAYLEGNLDYNKFCSDIDSISSVLKGFIQVNKLNRYKTAGNFALFEYFTKSNPLNGHKPFKYDFEDFTGETDFRKTFVTKLMETHTGQCRSLPVFYKILSEELGAESFLALAPNHLYIKHIDEYDRWVNIELTNGHFSTDAWMISSMNISAEAIKNKVYLDALNMKESIALLLTDLASAYGKKYGYDYFTLACTEKVMQHFPHYITALFVKFNTLQIIGFKYIDKYGQTPSYFAEQNYKVFKDTQKQIENLGYREITRENYEEWVRVVEKERENLLNSDSLNSNKKGTD